MRIPVLAGNWKMNTTLTEAIALVNGIKAETSDIKDREIVLCPPYPYLPMVLEQVKGTNIRVGAQNLYFEDWGAFTGEISAPMLRSMEVSHVIIGHSERRQYFRETDASVNKKIFAALKHGLSPIVCIGETLEQREGNLTLKVIETQISQGLMNLKAEQIEKLIIAYEPVWAIGTGKTATSAQAQEVHAFVRSLLLKPVAGKIRILYGGSVKPENIKELMAQEDIDGALVGGACLKADSFNKIIKY